MLVQILGDEISRLKAIWLVAMLLFTIINSTESKAKDAIFSELGIRVGISAPTERLDFESFEVFGNYGLPWSWCTEYDWIISAKVNGSVGALTQGGDMALFTTLGPVISISSPSNSFTFDVGGGFALVGEKKIGNHRFGGPFQFTAHGGVSYKFRWNLALGYRFYHMSDGGIFDGNGLNRHLLELGYHFE